MHAKDFKSNRIAGCERCSTKCVLCVAFVCCVLQVFSFHDTMRTLIHPLEPTPETEPSHFFALDPVAGSAAAHMGDSSLVDFSVTSNVLRNLGAYDTLIDQV